MKTNPNSANRFILPILPILMLALAPARAQVITNVSTAAELATALNQAFLYSQGAGNVLTNRITLSGNISANAQMIVNANVVIDGAGFSIDMNNADRAFFVAGGNVAISNLTIQNGNATGGSGGIGGGGGAGLGGAIFVGSGSYSGWTTDDNPQPIVAAQGVSVPSVTLSAVSFASNTATGGDSAFYFADGFGSGGGGMGGNSSGGGGDGSGGGGGGFGNSAAGGSGSGSAGAAGAFVNVSPTSGNTLAAGSGGNGSDGNGGAGGANGGGGGNGGSGLENVGSGGGGGVGAGRGYFVNSDPPNSGGNGGFGGGGGGNDNAPHGNGGAGGFGGGGGASLQSGGNGGFGGGGGKASSGSPGAGGFGAASATAPGGSGQNSAAGGGLGAGGAVFVMAGATLTVQDGIFSSNSVTGGSGGDGNNGSAYGADLFLGGNVTFNVSSNLTVNSLGGAGNLSDPNVSGNANDPNAQGGIVKTGAGNLTLTGTNYYTGVTTVNAGTLTLAPGAEEIGTQLVTVGQNNGDNATLVLGSSASLMLGGFNGGNGTDAPVMIAQSAGSTGTIVIGNGAGSSGAYIGARVFTGGAGDATVSFTQQYAAGSASDTIYPFYTTLTGSLGVTQDGAGTTQLQPLYGTNTFTGEVVVESGTLSTAGAVAALAGTTGITINGGALTLGQVGGVNDSASVNLNGGALQTGISLTETMGALTINGPSRIDFMGNSSALTFSALTIIDTLAIWNYSADDTLTILSGAALGDLGDITFYSDSGTTAVGTAMFDGNNIMPVPEPSTYALLALAAAALGAHVIRRRKRAKVS